ncbi:Sensory transduction protein regX3 [bacterium HR24]|jgi:DNA-binding response OmpR family regulator|nr:Sensory transduction protein regX3 [bacterium HR24]
MASPFQVLIVSRDQGPMQALAEALRPEGFVAAVVPPEGQGLEEALAASPDVVVLDLPSLGEGFDLASFLAARASRTETAFLALLSPDQLTALDPTIGLDDFALRTATAAEITARIRQALWRKARVDARHLLRQGDLVIDLASYRVFVGGRPVHLTYKEYELLRFLAANPGRVFSREELLNKVWGYEFYGGTRTVDVHVRRLRAKLETGHRTYIETVRNVGYRFRPAAE